MRAIGRALLATIILFALGGCSTASEETTSTPAEPEATQNPLSQSPSASPTESASAQPEVVPQPCSEAVEAGMSETISSQTSAFSEDDFELAYSYASPNFQSSVNLRSFVAIIAGSYGPLISSSSLSFSDCLMDPEQSFGLIEVNFVQSGENVYALRYVMVDTSDGWRVEGASNLAVVGKGA